MRLQLIHEVPGRVRVRCPGMRHDPGLSAAVEGLARDLPGFAAISTRPATESIILWYSVEHADAATFRSALEAHLDLTVSPASSRTPEGPVGAQLIRQVRRWWSEADRQALRATKGSLDLRTSVPWVLLLLALRQLVITGNLPALPWYTALYYSVQAILRHPDGAVHNRVSDDEGDAHPSE